MTTGLVPHDPKTGDYILSEPDGFEMKPRTLEEAMKFCEIMAKSDLVPTCYRDKPGNIMVAIQMGNELGMTPMRSLRSIAVINGRASMWGDDLLAMVQASPICEYVDESESTETMGVCKSKRKGQAWKELVTTFSLDDARRAGLLGKAGSWQTNQKRMLKLRARGFNLRDNFADVLAGLVTVEEALDLPKIELPETLPVPAIAPTLKDKLKAKVLETLVDVAPPSPASPQPESAQGDGLEPQRAIPQQVQDAPAPFEDPSVPWKAKINTAHDPKEVNTIYASVPEELKQDVHNTYFDKLKALGKAKAKK